jgi:hypothetical protein
MELNPSYEATNRSTTQQFPQHFMKPESSSPCSQEPVIGPYPKPGESSQYHPIQFLNDPF